MAVLTISVAEADFFRVRRSSDSVENDYSLREIDDGTLDTSVGVGDGCVTTWYDRSGNGNDVIQSTTTLQPKVAVAGVVQEGVVFDGTDDYFPLTVADVTLAGQTSATWCGWVRTGAIGAARTIYAEQTSTAGYGRISINISAAGKIEFNTRDSTVEPTGTNNQLLSTATLSATTWYHVSVVYTTNSKKIYLNGVLDNSATPTIGAFGSGTSAGIQLGQFPNNTNRFNGRLSDIRLYRGDALDDAEVASAYAGESVGSPLLWLKGNYSP